MAELGTYATELVGLGLAESVAKRLEEIYASGVLQSEELDDRAIDALKEFDEVGAVAVLDQFMSSDLSHVQNKSAFLCGVMKTYRAKTKQNPELAGDKRQGPDEDKIKALLERTGYTLDITTGQRKYGGPPPGWEGVPPATGTEKTCCQVFVGKVPRDMYEDELVPAFEECGKIYDFRLMMDSMTGLNKGYAFCTFSTHADAKGSVKHFENTEVRKGKKLGVCISVANCRLFVGSIPKTKSRQEILDEFATVTEELIDVIVYMSPDDKKKNRGFAFLEYQTHKAAALARRRLLTGKVKVWNNILVTVDWADPQEEPDDETMSKVKVVYVRNIPPEVEEAKLEEDFKKYGAVEKVKKIKDYAFIHFIERDDALKAIEATNGVNIDGCTLEVSLAKPQSGPKEKRHGQSGFGALNAPSRQPGGGGEHRGRGGRGGPRGGGGRGGRGGYGDGGGYGGYEGYDNYYGRGFDGGYDGYGGGYGGGYDDYYGGGGGGGYDDYYGRGPQRGPPRGGGPPGRGGPRGGGPPGRGGPRGGGPGGHGGPRGGGMGGRGGPRGGGMGGGGMGGGPRGGRGAPRGSPRGGMGQLGKRKFGADNLQAPVSYPEPKKLKQQGGAWGGSQPIAQQPLHQDYPSYDYGSGGGQEWFQDSYGAQWK